MYTTLSPCDMCTGAILLYGIPRVVIGENRTFMGDEDYLRVARRRGRRAWTIRDVQAADATTSSHATPRSGTRTSARSDRGAPLPPIRGSRIRARGPALDLITALLQRARLADATSGLWEAADFHWWWRKPRRSDAVAQTFWLDDVGPVGAVMLTDWDGIWGCDPIMLPSADPELADLVWAEAIERIDAPELGGDAVETRVRNDDSLAISRLTRAGSRRRTSAGPSRG